MLFKNAHRHCSLSRNVSEFSFCGTIIAPLHRDFTSFPAGASALGNCANSGNRMEFPDTLFTQKGAMPKLLGIAS